MTATLPHQVPAIIITDLARHSDDGVALMMLLRYGTRSHCEIKLPGQLMMNSTIFKKHIHTKQSVCPYIH